MDLAPGMVVGGHARLTRLLGEGGMGSVWLADHLRLDTPVAVKVIATPELRRDPKLVERLQREAKATARIKSPHIVQVFDRGTMNDGSPYIIMELLEGMSVRERIEQGIVPYAEAAEIVQQACSALAAAHRLGIVHRDIKPDNIFLCGDDPRRPFVKVLDFGIAVHTGAKGEHRLTSTDRIVGTPAYMSPEQILRADEPGPQTDMWAVAVTAYEMIVGDIPFDGDTLGAIMMAVSNGRYTPASTANPAVPNIFDPWFARAFQSLPDERFGTIEELADSFKILCEQAVSLRKVRRAQERAVTARTPPPDTPTEVMAPDPRSIITSDVQLGSRAVTVNTEPSLALPPGALAGSSAAGGGVAGGGVVGGGVAGGGVAGSSARDEPRTFGGASTPVRSLPARAGRRRLWMLASAAVVVLAAAGGIALNRQRTEPLIARRVLGSVTERVAEALRATPVDDGPDAPAGMVVIAAGSYPVGCDGDEAVGCLPNDRPSRTMSVKRFAIMRHEVTAAQYAACVSAGTCSAPDDDADCALGDGDQPARCVDWTGALAYCAQHGFRLPTEWEWEVAARGPEAHRFPWGADAPSCERTVMKTADGDGCGSGAPHEAGTKAKDVSWAGVYDLGGNVREWTASDYEGGGKKVNRGGSFIQGDGFMSAYTRDADPVSKARADLGFRCAVDF